MLWLVGHPILQIKNERNVRLRRGKWNKIYVAIPVKNRISVSSPVLSRYINVSSSAAHPKVVWRNRFRAVCVGWLSERRASPAEASFSPDSDMHCLIFLTTLSTETFQRYWYCNVFYCNEICVKLYFVKYDLSPPLDPLSEESGMPYC